MNNIVILYVRREVFGKFVLLFVMKYVVVFSILEKGVLFFEEECDLLNKVCKLVGFNFIFFMIIRIICLTDILKYCKVYIMEFFMENLF